MSEPATYPCLCGATVRVTRETTCGPSAVEVTSDFVIYNELRVRRRFAHEGSGMTDACHAHVLSLREQIGRSDLEALRELARFLEPADEQAP